MFCGRSFEVQDVLIRMMFAGDKFISVDCVLHLPATVVEVVESGSEWRRLNWWACFLLVGVMWYFRVTSVTVTRQPWPNSLKLLKIFVNEKLELYVVNLQIWKYWKPIASIISVSLWECWLTHFIYNGWLSQALSHQYKSFITFGVTKPAVLLENEERWFFYWLATYSSDDRDTPFRFCVSFICVWLSSSTGNSRADWLIGLCHYPAVNWKRDKKKSKWRLALILHLAVTKLQSSTIMDRRLQILMCGWKTLTQRKPKHLWNSRIKSLCLTWRSVGSANVSRRGECFCLVSLLKFLDSCSPTLSSYFFFVLNLKYNSYAGITM